MKNDNSPATGEATALPFANWNAGASQLRSLFKPEPAAGEAAQTYPGNSWYLIKRGLYYRPNSAGYTSVIEEAGVFSEAEASSHVRSTAGEHDPSMRVKMVRVPKGKRAAETDLKVKNAALVAALEGPLDTSEGLDCMAEGPDFKHAREQARAALAAAKGGQP